MLFSGVSISDESIKLWSSIGSRKSNLKACLHAFTEDRKKIVPIERATVEKDDPKPWESFCSLLREYGSDQVRLILCYRVVKAGWVFGSADSEYQLQIYGITLP